MTAPQDARRAEARAKGARRAELIRPLALAGMTGGQIGAYLDMSRSMVAGLCGRHGIKLGTRASAISRPAVTGSGGGCRYPLWAHGARPDHRYCGARATAPGRPYCAVHEAICWRKDEAE